MNFEPGKDFTDYIQLGKGGEGVVLRARQVSLNRTIVLKGFFNRDKSERKQHLELAGKLSGMPLKGVPKIFFAFEKKQCVWIGMEHIEGLPLSLLPVSQWPGKYRLHLIYETASLLGSLHDQGWVHGDLKPSNLFLDCHGEIHLLDLGFARNKKDTSTGAARGGTPAYLAPEALVGSEGKPESADSWSLGVICGEMARAGGVFYSDAPSGGPGDENDDARQQLLEIENLCKQADPTMRPAAKQISDRIQNKGDVNAVQAADFLSHQVTALFGERMAALCLEAANRLRSSRPQQAYRLVCESLEHNPDGEEALNLLEKLEVKPAVSPRQKVLLAGIPLLAACLLGVWFYWRPQPSPVPAIPGLTDEDRSSEAFQLGTAPAQKSGSPEAAEGEFHLPTESKKRNASLKLKGFSSADSIWLNGSLVPPPPKEGKMSLIAGEHKMVIKSPGLPAKVYEFQLLPFEKLELDLNKVSSSNE